MYKTLLPVFIFLTALTINHTSLSAQGYNRAAGIRIGTEFGFTIQQRIIKNNTIEGILQTGFFSKDVCLSALWEHHVPLMTRGFNLYYGAGPHIAWNIDPEDTYKSPRGATFIVGAEIRLFKLNISYDFKPRINIVGGRQIFESQSAISLRYVLEKRPKKQIKWKFWENDSKKKKR